MSFDSQAQFVENILRNIKSQSNHIKNDISKADMRACLKDSSELFSELKTSTLSPKNYYQIFTTIFDEINHIKNFIKDEHKRGRRLKELYEAVQQSVSIIPRVYLMIIVASVYLEVAEDATQEIKSDIIYDCMQMIKGIQNPTRGLFARYFLLKTFKEFFSANEDDIESIIENYKEMNRLWIRVGDVHDRNELKVLVGENVTRLTSLKISVDDYRDKILSKISKIIIEYDDPISQQYTLECFIHAFPDEYTVKCVDVLIDTVTKCNSGVDIKVIFVAIMDKLSRFVSLNGATKAGLKEIETVFNILNNTITKMVNDAVNQISEKENNPEAASPPDAMKITELQIAFLNFTIKCAPEEHKIQVINNIMSSTHTLLSKAKGDRKISQDGIKTVTKLLSTALESPVSIFQISSFSDLMGFLDEESQASLSLKIIDSLVNDFNLGVIDSKEKFMAVLELVRPLIINKNVLHNDNDISTLTKICYIPCIKNPLEQIETLNLIKETFIVSGDINFKFSMPVLVNTYLGIANSIMAASNKENLKAQNKSNELISRFDTEKLTEEELDKMLNSIFEVINDIIAKLKEISPELSFKLSMTSAILISNSTLAKYSEQCYNFISNSLKIITEGKIEQTKKFSCVIELIGAVNNMTIIEEEKMKGLIESLASISSGLTQRSEQATAMINCAKMYNSKVVKDSNKICSCLKEAKKYVDFSLVANSSNSIIYVTIINEYIMFDSTIDNFKESVKADDINELISYVKNYIDTLKSTKNDEEVKKIENYYMSTLNYIKKKKEEISEKDNTMKYSLLKEININ